MRGYFCNDEKSTTSNSHHDECEDTARTSKLLEGERNSLTLMRNSRSLCHLLFQFDNEGERLAQPIACSLYLFYRMLLIRGLLSKKNGAIEAIEVSLRNRLDDENCSFGSFHF